MILTRTSRIANHLNIRPAGNSIACQRVYSTGTAIPSLSQISTAYRKGKRKMGFVARVELEAAVNRVSGDKDAFQILWRSDPAWPRRRTQSEHEMEQPSIAILDSSFNPPHHAHLAIASSSPPPIIPDVSRIPRRQRSSPDEGTRLTLSTSYTSRLLVYSVRNIEKTPKPNDASTIQRLEMTIILANLISEIRPEETVAVGILNEPTFARKSQLIHSYVRSHINVNPSLSFLIGTDTLTRFFEPKFYPQGMEEALSAFFEPPPRGTGSTLVSARRGTTEDDRQLEVDVLSQAYSKMWTESGHVRLLGDGEEGWEEISSTRIRNAVKDGDEETLRELLPEPVLAYVREEGLYTG